MPESALSPATVSSSSATIDRTSFFGTIDQEELLRVLQGSADLQGICRANSMRHLGGERGRHGLEVVRLAAIVNGHLAPLPMSKCIAETLHARDLTYCSSQE